jgi:thiazole synthase ThiGH ThiG subunit
LEDLIISGKKYKSRLILGTGKYKSFEETAKAIEAAEVEIVTVAVRRVNVTNPKEPMLVDYLSAKYGRLLYGRRSIKNFKTSQRCRRVESCKIRSAWR